MYNLSAFWSEGDCVLMDPVQLTRLMVIKVGKLVNWGEGQTSYTIKEICISLVKGMLP